MKSRSLFLITVSFLLCIACKKNSDTTENNNNLYQQSHDQNAVMKIMHQMMDSMDMMQPAFDPDIDFAMMMRTHHRGAVNMAQYELNNGKDATMKAKAQVIINAQNKEIQDLSQYLAAHPTPDNIDSSFIM